MDVLFLKLLNMSISATWLILAVMALRLILGRRTPKWLFCALWGLVALRLLVPFQFESKLSLIPRAETVPMTIVSQEPERQAPVPTLAVPEAPAAVEPEAVGSEAVSKETAPASTVEAPAPARTLRDWVEIFAWVWAIGAAALLIYALCSSAALKRRISASVCIRGNVYLCDYIDTPFIFGLVKPKIYLPSSLPAESMPYVLAHEKAHLRRRDHWWKPLGFLLLCIYWFHPIVWVAYILLCRDIELACDEHVIRSMGRQEKKAYSTALLTCSMPKYLIAACPLAFGEVSVKERVRNVLNYRKPGFWIFLICLLIVFVTALCFLTNPREAAAEPPATDPITDTHPLSDEEAAAKRVQDGFDALLAGDSYHLLFMEGTYDGSIGWQIHFYKQGEDTLWWSTDHRDEEGHMVYGGKQYSYIQADPAGWALTAQEDDSLTEVLKTFSMSGKKITDVNTVTETNDFGETYDKLTLTLTSTGEDGTVLLQPLTANFSDDGTLIGLRLDNCGREGADIFTFSNWSSDGDTESRFQWALENILTDVDPDNLAGPTEDEALMKEWGIDFLVQDDNLTRSGSDIWFVQAEGKKDVVSTDNRYWLEKKTENGWEELPMIVEDVQWEEASYTLGTGMYTMVQVDWSKLYGDLPSGTYRMGKIFTRQAPLKTCTGYAEFKIFYNDAITPEQTAAVEKCYAALEELKARAHIHYKFSNTTYTEEVWYNQGNFLTERTNSWLLEADPDMNVYVLGRTARLDGIGYTCVYEDPANIKSPIAGMKLATLTANRAGWELYSLAESLYISNFERDNQVIDFSADTSCITDTKICFRKYWSDPSDYTEMTYHFDADGKLTKMEWDTNLDSFHLYRAYEIFPTTAAEIDRIIQESLENVMADPFSWAEAKAEYTDDKYNIRQDSFVNNAVSPITGPADAARRAKLEYPNLKDIIGTDVFYDEEAKMWKVTFEKYVDYQSTYEYRDIYMTESGITVLLVYEGPVEERT